MAGTANIKIVKSIQKIEKLVAAKKYAEGLRKCKKVISKNPELLLTYKLKGYCLHGLGRFQEAVQMYEKVFESEYVDLELCTKAGFAYMETKDFSNAASIYERGLNFNPSSSTLYNNIANALKKMGVDINVVAEHYIQAIRLQPDEPIYYFNLCKLHYESLLYDNALKIALSGLEQCPDSLLLTIYAADIHRESGNIGAALKLYLHAFSLNPNSLATMVKIIMLAKLLCDWDEEQKMLSLLLSKFDELYAKRRVVIDDQTLLELVPPHDMLIIGLPNDIVQKQITHYANIGKKGLAEIKFSHTKRSSKIRIGYVSPDFDNHPVGLIINDVFKHHDRDNFEIVGYFLKKEGDSDDVTKIIKDNMDEFRFLGGMSYLDSAKIINSDNIDILVDLGGYTFEAKPAIFEMKPAPIQCHFVGFQGTMGTKAYDYYITTIEHTPEPIAKYFTEKMAYVTGMPLGFDKIMPREDLPSKQALGLPDDKFIFYCFSNTARINQKTFDVWLKILNQTPSSVLWLMYSLEPIKLKLLKYAADKGYTEDRFIFTTTEVQSQRGIYRHANLMLDTLDISSGTGAIIPVSSNIPVLTLEGNTVMGRSCATVLNAVNMNELIAHNIDEYVETAVNLASDKAYYDSIVEKLRIESTDDSVLFDRKSALKNLEAAYTRMYDNLPKN